MKLNKYFSPINLLTFNDIITITIVRFFNKYSKNDIGTMLFFDKKKPHGIVRFF